MSIRLKKNAIELKLLSDISTSSTARVLVMELLSVKLQKCFEDILTSSEIVSKLNSVQSDRLYKEVLFCTNLYPFAPKGISAPDLSIDIEYIRSDGKKDAEKSVLIDINSRGSYRSGFFITDCEYIESEVVQDFLSVPFGVNIFN